MTNDGFPLLALLFYCFRCGDAQAALEVAKQEAVSPTFLNCLQERAKQEKQDRVAQRAYACSSFVVQIAHNTSLSCLYQRRLPAELWKKLSAEFNSDLASKCAMFTAARSQLLTAQPAR